MQATLNDFGAVEDPLEFGNCRYRFMDPVLVPKKQKYLPDYFQGVICIYLGFDCGSKNNEWLCGCWVPRNPKKGKYWWTGSDPFKKPKYGPREVPEDWKLSDWDKLVAERIHKKGPGWWRKE